MILRKGVVAGWVVGVFLAGCGGSDRPTGLGGDGSVMLNNPDSGTIMLSDVGGGLDISLSSDGPAPDFGVLPDMPPIDRQAPPDNGTATDVPVGSDASGDVSLVVDTGPDAGRTRRTFCDFTQAQMVRLAVRTATCLRESPQRVLEQMYRPSYWESGVLARRPCSVLRAALDTNTGCAGFLGEVLKLTVEPTSTGTCASPIVGCRPGAPGHVLATTCRNGLSIGEDCETITGRSECVASTSAVACVPVGPETAGCSATDGPRCYNGRLQNCVSGAYVNIADCDPFLTNCDVAANACVGTGASCTAGDADRCDGTSIQQCRGGRLQSNNCTFLVTGSSCRTVGGHSFCGTGTDCDPVSSPADGACDGSTLVLCAGGVVERVNCVTAGFVGCGVGGCTQ